MFKKTVLCCLICAALIIFTLTLLPNQALAKSVFKFTIITEGDIWSPEYVPLPVFKNYVETGTNGEIEVQLFPAGSLGKEREIMEMLKNNNVQGTIAAPGAMSIVFPLYGVLDTPFVMPNESVADDVFDGWFGDKLKKLIQEKTGFRCLTIVSNGGFFHFTNNKKQIRALEDIKGIKFRVMAMPSQVAFFKAMGTSAVPISWAELYTSLQTGVVEGQHNQPCFIIMGKLYEVQKYLTISSHIYSVGFFLVNNSWFQSLTEEQKTVVMNAARVARTASRGIEAIGLSTDEKGIPFLAKHMDTYTLPPKERGRFLAATTPGMNKYIEETLGKEGVALQADYLKAIKESSKKLGY